MNANRLSKIHNLKPLPTENSEPCLQKADVVYFLREKETLLDSVNHVGAVRLALCVPCTNGNTSNGTAADQVGGWDDLD
jgi:hypothetical protein